MNKLVMSKTLRGSYAAGAGKMPHVEAVARMRARADPDVELPRSGDRVQFVVVQRSDPKAKTYECTEDPEFVRKQDLSPHWLYYLDNQLLPPIRRLFEPFDAQTQARIEAAATDARHRLIRHRDGLRDIRACFGTAAAPAAAPPGAGPRVESMVTTRATHPRKRQATLRALLPPPAAAAPAAPPRSTAAARDQLRPRKRQATLTALLSPAAEPPPRARAHFDPHDGWECYTWG